MGVTEDMTTMDLLPQASLREEWSVSTVERLARTMGRPAVVPRTGPIAAVPSGPPDTPKPARSVDPARRDRRTEALLRLAMNSAAAPAERALAAERAAEYLRLSA
jgi:hypothetical protein